MFTENGVGCDTQVNPARTPVSQPTPSSMNTRDAPHTLVAPRLPWVMQGKSKNLMLGGRRLAVVMSGCKGAMAVGGTGVGTAGVRRVRPDELVI